jgi:DNA-3-methyladenine glycosylase II
LMAFKAAAKFENISDPRIFASALDHLRQNDRRLARVIDKHGVMDFKTSGEIFESLVESIIGQQVSGYAANAIISRVRALYATGQLEPEAIYRTHPKTLQKAGLSPQKLRYLKDLSRRIVKKEIEIESLKELSDDELLNALDPVLGIGPWTVQMLLIFTLGRANVLPVDDLGIRKSIQDIYALKELPSAEQIRAIAKNWQPYCSVASLYLWKNKDAVQPISAERRGNTKKKFPPHVHTSKIKTKRPKPS